jgi:esterase/lipase superfamily enzyme
VRRHQIELPLGGGMDRPMTVISYGHYGRPVLVFPSEAGRAWDFENNGMLAGFSGLSGGSAGSPTTCHGFVDQTEEGAS